MAIKVFIAGDVVPRDRTIPLFKSKQTEELFGSILPVINESDIRVVNLEAPIINGAPTPIKKSGPILHTTKETVEVLKDAGFDVVTLANNHFRDQGEQGIRDTIKALKNNGLYFVGGGENVVQAGHILYRSVSDRQIAFINACEHEFSIATEGRGGSNALELVKVYRSITEARKQADYVVVIIHGGLEMYQLPTLRMKETYRFFVDAGADAVVNHHQHCFSGYEVYKGKPIFYGLGNFCFDWEGRRNSIWNQGYAITLTFSEKVEHEIHPYVQCDECPAVCLQDNGHYKTSIKKLNEIIADDRKLEERFSKYALEKKRDFLYTISPFDNRYVAALNRRGILGSLYPNRKLYAVKNLIWCESHRDTLMEILKQETN